VFGEINVDRNRAGVAPREALDTVSGAATRRAALLGVGAHELGHAPALIGSPL
jgi:hypothetical protein